MKKIALIVPGGMDRSGTHRVIPALLWLIKRLARRHDVHVFSLQEESDLPAYSLHGATVHACGAAGPFERRLWALRSIFDEQRRQRFDLFHAFWANPSGAVAALAGGILQCPVVVHLAGGELAAIDEISYGGQSRLRGRLQVALALTLADSVTAPSWPMCQAAARKGCRAIRVPLGVDLEAWPVRPPRSRDPNRPPRLLHVGSLNRVKDQTTLLRAASIMARRGLSFRLGIVGVDTLDGRIQELSQYLGVRDRTEFHGFLPHERLRRMMEDADLLLMSSRHEAGPLVLLEAAVVGVPCVGTAVGHIAEWAPSAAIAVPVGDATALAEETLALLADEPRRQRLARAAYERALREDADFSAQQVEAVYSDLLGRDSGAFKTND